MQSVLRQWCMDAKKGNLAQLRSPVMFVITAIFFPELFAPFWLILTPIRKGSIVFKGLLHLHYILCGSHSKAIKNQKKYSSLCWDLPSIIRFTNELLSRFFSPLMITFFPKWILKYLFSTFILWVKRSSLSPRIYLMAAFSQENNPFSSNNDLKPF